MATALLTPGAGCAGLDGPMFLLDAKAPGGSAPGSDGCELLARWLTQLGPPHSDL